MDRLRSALAQAKAGRGGTWLVLGPGGMGKTRLLRWLEREAANAGFQVSWGNGLQESVAPFFVFEQVFRKRSQPRPDEEVGSTTGAVRLEELGSYLLFEDDRPRRFRSTLAAIPAETPLLLITRENPSSLRERGPPLSPRARTVWVTRMEGEGRVAPGNLDALGEQASRFFREHSGGLLALDGIEYLTSQNTFPAVLQLLQFLRDLAQESQGHLLVAANPAAFERREVSLLESDAEVVRPQGPKDIGAEGLSETAGSAETPSATLLRYLHALEVAAQGGPQLIVVDDLHWADPQSGTAFQFLARNLRNLPVLIVGGAREDEIPAEAEEQGTALADRLDLLSREGLLERVRLNGFREEEARALSAQVLGGTLDPAHGHEELEELLRRTEGNPYFLRELFVQLRQDGTLLEEPGGFRFKRVPGGTAGLLATVPGSLRRMVLQRIGHLTPEERAFMDTAVVAGSEFDIAPVAAVRSLSVGEAQRLVSSLAHHRRLLEPLLEDPGHRWSFSHPLVWEVAMGELSSEHRQKEARGLMVWWEEHRPGEVETLARLAHESQDPARGMPWVRRALERALTARLPEAAATYLGWVRELRLRRGAECVPEEAETEIDAAGQLLRIGGPRQARRFLLSLLTEPMPDELRWKAAIGLITASDSIDSTDARRRVKELREEFARRGKDVPPKLRHQLEAFASYLALQEGKTKEAMEVAERVLKAPPEEMGHATRGRVLMLVTSICHIQGRLEDAEGRLSEFLEWAGDDDQLLAAAHNLAAVIAETRGDNAGMYESARRAAACASRAGMFVNAAIYEYNAAIGALRSDKVEEAEASGQHLLDLGNKFDVPRVRCCGYFLLSLVADRRREWSFALVSAQRALEEAEAMHRNDDIWECRGLLAQVKGNSGDLTGALAEIDILETSGYLEEASPILELGPRFVGFLEAAGHRTGARQLAERVRTTARKFKNTEAEREMSEAISRLESKPRARRLSPSKSRRRAKAGSKGL